jgi:formylglycine-generating enzyme required for sulfatase activity
MTGERKKDNSLYPPITLKRLTMNNIKCFKHVELSFKEKQRARSWTVLVGDNGVGKTTILHCIALCALGPELASKIGPLPQNMLRVGAEKGYMEAVFEAYFKPGDNRQTNGEVTIRLNIEKGSRTFNIHWREESKQQNRLNLLAAKALCDFQPAKRDQAVISLARDKLYRLMASESSIEERFQAGVLVGELGDSRIDHDNMVHIPAGEFIRGSNEFDEKEKPEKRIFLDDFKIGKYPVTNHEFTLFIADNGYSKEEFWSAEGWQWRARSPGGNIYPWGQKFDKHFCNSRELDLKRTNPLGVFPNGKSSYGCFDMAGNVMEWCQDWYDIEYYRISPSKNPLCLSEGYARVNRGGCWSSDAVRCASAFRGSALPTRREPVQGMRLVMSL